MWINFRKPGVISPFATYTFVSRILEDCNSHLITLYVRESGLCSLSIDNHERARFTIGTMAPAVLDAIEKAANRASVPFSVAENARKTVRNSDAREEYCDSEDGSCSAGSVCDENGQCQCDDEAGGCPGAATCEAGGDCADEEASESDAEPSSNVQEFFAAKFASITLSGWGITALASKETAFGSIPWSFDNIYVGESLEQAKAVYTNNFLPQSRAEQKVPACSYIERF